MQKNILAGLALAFGFACAAQAADGTLTINVAAFTSEVELKPKIQKQLQAGGVEWGVNGNRLVFTTVNKQFVGVDINEFTRFGTNTTLQLPAGTYTVHCVGLIPDGGMSVSKLLSKGGYFNENLMTFEVAEGQITTLDLRPVIKQNNTFLLKFFIPDYLTKVTFNGATSEEISLNARTDKSVKWDDYNGDLKFKK
jgi:hypothetical protein